MKPWVEKYRPHIVDDMTHQKEISRLMKESIETGNLPHLIFHGPPGTGKTSSIHCFTKEVYPKNKKDYVLELNASDERDINTVRFKIKEFSKRAIGRESICKFKLVILDEADTMTIQAQSALRRIMEDYSNVTRFCFICNYISKIMSPILSRCANFRFKPIPVEDMVQRLEFISRKEDIHVGEDMLIKISESSGGDMRKSIFNLQMVSIMNDGEVCMDVVDDICGNIPESIMENMLEIVNTKNFLEAQEFVNKFLMSGFPVEDMLHKITLNVVRNKSIGDISKGIICRHIAVTENNLIDGCGEYIQLLDLIGIMMKNIK